MATGDKISGENGTVKYGAGDTEIEITKWSIKKKTSGVVPVNDSGSAGKMENLPAKFIGFDGSFEGFLEKGVAGPTFNSIVAAKFELDTGVYFGGSIIIQEESVNCEVDGTNAVLVGYTFEGTGELALTNPTS